MTNARGRETGSQGALHTSTPSFQGYSSDSTPLAISRTCELCCEPLKCNCMDSPSPQISPMPLLEVWSPLRVPCGRFDPAAFLTRQAGSTCFSSREIHKICLGPAATVELDSGVAREREKLPWCDRVRRQTCNVMKPETVSRSVVRRRPYQRLLVVWSACEPVRTRRPTERHDTRPRTPLSNQPHDRPTCEQPT